MSFRKKNNGNKSKRKQLPSQPAWVWYNEYCVFCPGHNCGKCPNAKYHRDVARKKNKREVKKKLQEGDYESL